MAKTASHGSMMQTLGKATPINVRKLPWPGVALDPAFEHGAWALEFKATETLDLLELDPNGSRRCRATAASCNR